MVLNGIKWYYMTYILYIIYIKCQIKYFDNRTDVIEMRITLSSPTIMCEKKMVNWAIEFAKVSKKNVIILA